MEFAPGSLPLPAFLPLFFSIFFLFFLKILFFFEHALFEFYLPLFATGQCSVFFFPPLLFLVIYLSINLCFG